MKPKNKTVQHLGLIALAFAGVSSPLAHAASDAWAGTTNSSWATTTNWLGGSVPGTGNTATFNGAGNGNTTIDLGAGVTLGSLLFDTSSAAAYTIGSGAVGSQTLSLDNAGALTINPGVTTAQTINANLSLNSAANATTTFTNNGSGLLTIAGTVNANVASGNGRLTIAGSGNTTISGAVTKTGAGSNALFKSGSGTLTLSNGSTWSGSGASQSLGTGTNGNSAFSGPVIIQEGTLLLNGGTHTVTGEAVIGGISGVQGGAGKNAKIQIDAGALNISGYLSVGRGNGVGGVSSDLVLNNAATVSAANFAAGYNGGNSLNMPKGAITLNNTSSLSINTAGEFHLGESTGANFTMTLNDTSTVTLNGTPSGTGAQSAAKRYIGGPGGGTGTLTLAGSGATFTDASTNASMIGFQNGTGTVNVNAGTFNHTNGELVVAGSFTDGAYTGSGTVNVAGGTLNTKALTVGRNNNDVASTFSGTVNVSAGTVNVTAATSLIGWRGIGTTGTLNISGGTFNQGTTALANMSIGSFTGANGIVTVSSGALTFQNNSGLRFADTAGANASTRTLTISGGNVTFYSNAGTTVGGTGTIDLMTTANALGVNTINLDGGTLTANQIKATSATGTRVINFNGGTLKTASSGLASTFLASGVASTANVRNGGAIIDTNGNTVTIGQTLVHSTIGTDNAIDGGMTMSGSGTLTLSGANTYTGATAVNAGTLKAGVASVANTSGAFGNNSAVTMANVAGATLDITGFNTQIGSLTGGGVTGGNVVLGAATLTTGGNNTSPAAYAGVISGTGGALTKIGTGTLTLTGTNTYTGNTTVNAGKLVVNGNSSTSTLTTINNTATLGGSGTIGALVVMSGGTVAPGNSPGILSAGSTDLQTGSTLSMDINGSTLGTGYDQLNITGTVSLTGALSLSLGGYTPVNSTLFFILANDSTDAITGTFSNASIDGSTYTLGGQDFRISYFGDSTGGTFTGGNDVVLMAVPEPQAALLGGLGMLALLRRRRMC